MAKKRIFRPKEMVIPMGKNGEAWTNAEKKALRVNYKTEPIGKIANDLNKSEAEIINELFDLKIVLPVTADIPGTRPPKSLAEAVKTEIKGKSGLMSAAKIKAGPKGSKPC